MVFTKLSYYLLISLVISCTSWSVKRPNNCMTLKLPSSMSAIMINSYQFSLLLDVEIGFGLSIFYSHEFFMILSDQGFELTSHSFP